MRLDYLRDRFPDVPLIACTATATAKVIEDIKKTLRLEQSPSYIGSFDRPNIFYKVKYKDSLNSSKVGGASQDLVSFIQKQHQLCFKKNVQCSGIVYCHTRADTEELASAIRKGTGIKTEAYHGGMKPDERQRVQESWTVGESQIAVATVAFGMGIDLAHVRYVVHWNLAKTPESFYQESGRAGRDGLPAFSVLYYSNDDANKFQFLLSQRKSEKGDKEPLRELSSLKEMVNYCMVPGCRRVRLLQHFGEKMDDPKQVCYSSCDYCLNPTRVQQAIEAASVANDFVSYTRMPEQKKRNPNDGHDDDNDDECMIKVWNVGDLHVTGTMVDDTNDFSEKQNKPVNFEKASSILAKYEAIECKSSGFVNFKQTTDTRVRVPQHLIPPTRSVSREPSHENVPVAKEVNVADLTAETNRLREALSKARTAKEEKQTQTLNGNKERRPPPPPPPIVLLATKRKR